MNQEERIKNKIEAVKAGFYFYEYKAISLRFLKNLLMELYALLPDDYESLKVENKKEENNL